MPKLPGFASEAFNVPALPNVSGQISSVANLLSAILAKLSDIDMSLNSQSETREDEIIVANIASVGTTTYYTPVQLRITALVVYTAAAGAYQVVIGNDNTMVFLGQVNARVPVIDNDLQRIVVPRGLPITITGIGAWNATIFARAGVSQGAQS